MKLGNAIMVSWIVVLLSSLFWIIFDSRQDSKANNDLSIPVNIYSSPDSTDFFVFDVDVDNEMISIAKTHFDTTGNQLNYSDVVLLQKVREKNPELKRVSTNQYPVEAQPFLFRSRSGNLHLFWGERRADPYFEEFDRSGAQLLFDISTTLMHSKIEPELVSEPEVIFEGSLSKIFMGNGGLTLPGRVTEDENGVLHIILTAEGIFEDIGNNHSVGLGYISQSENSSWNPARFILSTKFNPDIEALSNNNIVIAFRGSDRLDPDGTSNDINIIHSNDGGTTWSGSIPVFRAGEQTTSEVNLMASPNGDLHLFWSRYLESGLEHMPDEVWHSVSTDGGLSWPEPYRFFKLEIPPGYDFNFIRSMDIVIDSYGQAHWALVSSYGEFEGNSREGSELYYTKWNPVTKSWQQAEKLNIAERPLITKLAVDEPANQLYLFWDERDERALYYSIMNIEKPSIEPPILGNQGPLQLHANYPNPFNPSTQITFTLEEQADVELTVYDMSGRKLLRRDLGARPEGMHSEEVNLQGYASGTYIYEIALNGTWRQQSTMMFIR